MRRGNLVTGGGRITELTWLLHRSDIFFQISKGELEVRKYISEMMVDFSTAAVSAV